MSEAAAIVVGSHLAIIVFGLPVAFHPAFRSMFGWPARLALAFLTGAVALTIEGLLLSLFGVSWGERSLFLPLALLAIVLSVRWGRRPRPGAQEKPPRPAATTLIASAILIPAALAHLFASILLGRSTSMDFLFFWGVKGARFASARGIDVEFLREPFANHAHANYPPLFPMTLAWSETLSADVIWDAGMLTSGLWLIPAIPLLIAILRRRVGPDAAIAITTFWTIAVATSLSISYSAGNAEAPLLVFVSVAAAALMLERSDEPKALRAIVAIAAAGMLLTKIEGNVIFFLLIGGWLVREVVLRSPQLAWRFLAMAAPALAAIGTWWLFSLVKGVSLTDPAREQLLNIHFNYVGVIVREMGRNLAAGTYGLSWLLPLIFLMSHPRRSWRFLPGLTLLLGLLAFYFFYYLHSAADPSILISWTASRVSQPALAGLILLAGLVTFAPRPSLRPPVPTDSTPAPS
jgi:hypothetical protein